MGKTALATNIAFKSRPRRLERAADGSEIEAPEPSPSSPWKCRPSSWPPASSPSRAEVPLRRRSAAATSPDDDSSSVVEASRRLSTLPLFIDDTPAISVSALRTRARRLKRQHGLSLIVVDYLQLMRPPRRQRADNRVQEISEITRGLKALAKELNVPVLALSQLSRAPSSSARTSARSSPTCANPARSSRTPTSSCSSSARNTT